MRLLSSFLCATVVALGLAGDVSAADVDVSVGRGWVEVWVGRSDRVAAYQPAPVVQGPLIPTPEPAPLPGTVEGHSVVVEPPQSFPLFPNVRYKDRDEMHPRAVPVVIAVPDPSFRGPKCADCPDPVVYIEICVPPNCEPEEIDIDRGGREIEYEFDEYEVDVRLKRGYIEVDYQD